MTGLDDDAARREFVGSGTTLLWLTKHLARAELLWVLRRFAGSDVDIPTTRVHPRDTLAAAVRAYRNVWRRVDAVVAAASLDRSCREVGDESPVTFGGC